MANNTFTLDDLNMLCWQWQKRLRLQDWEIEVFFVHQSTMRDYLAQIEIHPRRKAGIIKIPTAESFCNSGFPEQDMELSIVHELIHLHLETWMPDKQDDYQKYQDAERAIEMMSQALINQQREIQRAVGMTEMLRAEREEE